MNKTRARTIILSLTIALVGQFCVTPTAAHAQLIVEDPANLAVNTATAAGVSTQTLILNQLNGLAWTVAKVAIKSITRSTVTWINSGFQGSPAFVTDLQANLNVLSDTVADNFFQQINRVTTNVTGFNLVSPFQDQINEQLRSNYYKATGSLLGLNQYDLNGYSSDPRAFINGDFRQGGINAFFSANQNPANNPFGAYLQASDALFNQIDTAAKNRRDEVIGNKGFLSFRKNCNPSGSNVALAKTDVTFGCSINTPGSVIEAQLENQLGSGVRQLELADSINEIVGALVGQLVNQVLGSGGLSGVSQPSSGGGASYIDQATNGAGSSTGLTSGLAQTISNELLSLTNFRNNWQKILGAANSAQQACGARSDITTVIDQATAAVAKGSAAFEQESAISALITNASNSSSVDASTKLTAAITQYQTFLGSPTNPSSSEREYAEQQSVDTGSSSSPSLYSQMVQAANSCTVAGTL